MPDGLCRSLVQRPPGTGAKDNETVVKHSLCSANAHPAGAAGQKCMTCDALQMGPTVGFACRKTSASAPASWAMTSKLVLGAQK